MRAEGTLHQAVVIIISDNSVNIKSPSPFLVKKNDGRRNNVPLQLPTNHRKKDRLKKNGLTKQKKVFQSTLQERQAICLLRL